MKVLSKYFVSNFEVLKYDEVSSTMKIVKNYKENTAVMTQKQTSGRGKQGRKWECFNGNLYFSVMLNAKKKLKDYSQISFLSAIAMHKSISSIDNKKLNLQCKWPNDILLNQKKICGILLEFDIKNNQLIIGIGVNVKYSPKIAMYKATSLYEEGITNITPQELLKSFLINFSNLYRIWNKEGFAKIRGIWLKNAYKLNQEISVKLKEELYKGTFKDLDKDGTLILKLKDNSVKKIKSGDVF